MKYVLGKQLKGYFYKSICHGINDCIFWWSGNKFHKHISKGTLMDNHCHLVKDADLDDIWRGRTSVYGNTIVMPPLEVYNSKNVKLPVKIFNMIYKEFHPDNVFIELAGKGLVQVINTSKK